MTRRTRVLLTTTAAVTMLGLASPTSAGQAAATPLGGADGVRYTKSSVLLTADSGTPTATGWTSGCGKGRKAVAGGQTIGLEAGQGISDSFVGQDKYWYSSVWRNPDVRTRLTTFAVCLKNPDINATTVVASKIPASSMVTKDVWCAEGAAVSGGVMTLGNADDYSLNASFPIDSPTDADTVPDDGWRSYVDYSGAGGDSVHFSGTCLKSMALAYTSAVVTVPSQSAGSFRAGCPKGSTVVGGGLQVPGATGSSHVVASRPWDSKDSGTVPDDGWRAGVLNKAPHSLEITVHAVCDQHASIF